MTQKELIKKIAKLIATDEYFGTENSKPTKHDLRLAKEILGLLKPRRFKVSKVKTHQDSITTIEDDMNHYYSCTAYI